MRSKRFYLEARSLIPMHWGTYSFGTDHHEGPRERISSWWISINLSTKQLVILKAGQTHTSEPYTDNVFSQPFIETIL